MCVWRAGAFAYIHIYIEIKCRSALILCHHQPGRERGGPDWPELWARESRRFPVSRALCAGSLRRKADTKLEKGNHTRQTGENEIDATLKEPRLLQQTHRTQKRRTEARIRCANHLLIPSLKIKETLNGNGTGILKTRNVNGLIELTRA